MNDSIPITKEADICTEKPSVRFETERLLVRSAKAEDKEPYMSIRIRNSSRRKMYEMAPALKESVWDSELNAQDTLSVSAFLKEEGTLIAIASFQGFPDARIELGVDVGEEYRNRGFATELISGMIRMSHSLFPSKGICLKTYKDNYACRRVAEKCGGVLSGFEPTPGAKVAAVFLKEMEENPPKSGDWEELLREREEYAEKNKESVCIYSFHRIDTQ